MLEFIISIFSCINKHFICIFTCIDAHFDFSFFIRLLKEFWSLCQRNDSGTIDLQAPVIFTLFRNSCQHVYFFIVIYVLILDYLGILFLCIRLYSFFVFFH